MPKLTFEFEEEVSYEVRYDHQFIGKIWKCDRFIFSQFRDSPLSEWIKNEISAKLWRLNNEHHSK